MRSRDIYVIVRRGIAQANDRCLLIQRCLASSHSDGSVNGGGVKTQCLDLRHGAALPCSACLASLAATPLVPLLKGTKGQQAHLNGQLLPASPRFRR